MVMHLKKVDAALPGELQPDTVYYVRTGAGFDEYVTDATGNVAHKPNTLSRLSWIALVSLWDQEPVKAGDVAEGEVWEYVYEGISRYRLVPSPYAPANDIFYSDFVSGSLSGPISARGEA